MTLIDIQRWENDLLGLEIVRVNPTGYWIVFDFNSDTQHNYLDNEVEHVTCTGDA